MKKELADYLNAEAEKTKARQREKIKVGPPITQVEFDESDFPKAEKIAEKLGYTQTAYTSTSSLWGLFCLRDKVSDEAGVIIKTKEFGFLFVQDLEDLNIEIKMTNKKYACFRSNKMSFLKIYTRTE